MLIQLVPQELLVRLLPQAEMEEIAGSGLMEIHQPPQQPLRVFLLKAADWAARLAQPLGLEERPHQALAQLYGLAAMAGLIRLQPVAGRAALEPVVPQPQEQRAALV